MYILKKTTLGLIAARKNSVGVKNKNLIKIKDQEIILETKNKFSFN